MSIWFKNNLSDIKRMLSADLEYHKASLEAWKKVTIKKKKDGSEYVNLSRAMEGAKEVFEYNSFNRVKVYFRTSSEGYKDDYIDIYGYLDELPDEDERKKEYVQQFLRQKYIFTNDEIREAIKKKIGIELKTIKSLEQQILLAEKYYNEFHETFKKAHDTLSAKTKEGMYNNSLYYYITETH